MECVCMSYSKTVIGVGMDQDFLIWGREQQTSRNLVGRQKNNCVVIEQY